VADNYEHGNETSGSIKRREFRDWLSDYQLLKMESAAWCWLVTYKKRTIR